MYWELWLKKKLKTGIEYLLILSILHLHSDENEDDGRKFLKTSENFWPYFSSFWPQVDYISAKWNKKVIFNLFCKAVLIDSEKG